MAIYWTEEQELAIAEYVKAVADNDIRLSNLIFNEKLLRPLKKLVECTINVYKNRAYINENDTELKYTLLTKVMFTLDRIDISKGKAFSYLSTVLKYELINLNRNAYKELKMFSSLDSDVKDYSDKSNKNYINQQALIDNSLIDAEKIVDTNNRYYRMLKEAEETMYSQLRKTDKKIPLYEFIFDCFTDEEIMVNITDKLVKTYLVDKIFELAQANDKPFTRLQIKKGIKRIKLFIKLNKTL